MNKTRAEIAIIHDRLLNYFLEGEGGYIVFMGLRKAYKLQPFLEEDIFISALANFSLKTMVLTLANILVDDRDSIRLNYLFNCIINSKQQFKEKEYKEITETIAECKKLLVDNEQIVNKVVESRNKGVAHIDIGQVTKPDFFTEMGTIKVEEFGLLFSIIGSVLFELEKYFGLHPNATDFVDIGNFNLESKTVDVYNFLFKEKGKSFGKKITESAVRENKLKDIKKTALDAKNE